MKLTALAPRARFPVLAALFALSLTACDTADPGAAPSRVSPPTTAAGVPGEPPRDSPGTGPAPAIVVDRSSAAAAVDCALAAIGRRDAGVLDQVVAPRARGALDGKGKLKGLAAAVGQGVTLKRGAERPGPTEDGRQVVVVSLDRIDGSGGTQATAARLNVMKFDDGWRVEDFDQAGPWPK